MLCNVAGGQLALNFYRHCEISCVSAADRSHTFDIVNFIVRVNVHTTDARLLISYDTFLSHKSVYLQASFAFPPEI